MNLIRYAVDAIAFDDLVFADSHNAGYHAVFGGRALYTKTCKSPGGFYRRGWVVYGEAKCVTRL